MSQRKIAIVGGGPIGLEAALAASECGFTVVLFEAGLVGKNLRDWGHVKLFSPFGMNISQRSREALTDAGHELPADDAMVTGREMVERYLEPLADFLAARAEIHQRTRVVGMRRGRLLKGEAIGNGERERNAFTLLVEQTVGDGSVAEFEYEADIVLDCTGTYPHHNWLGRGGIPALGERRFQGEIEYGLPDLLGRKRATHVGKTTLVLGSGYSAATNVVALAKLAEEAPETEIVWVTRGVAEVPISPIDDDPLQDRARLTERANALAMEASAVTWKPGRVVAGIDRGEGRFRIQLESVAGAELVTMECDNIIANVGFRPDRSLYEELQVHECYASQGPMKLAAALLGESGGECMTQTSHGIGTLMNPEPDFFILGSKSYGRNSHFLLRIGLQQIDDVMSHLSASLPVTA